MNLLNTPIKKKKVKTEPLSHFTDGKAEAGEVGDNLSGVT